MKKQLLRMMMSFVLLILAPILSLSSAHAAPGDFLFEFGRMFLIPAGVAEDQSGNVYVADAGRSCIVKVDSMGRFLAQWGSPGSGNGQFQNPAGLALDNNGNLYVADLGNNRIQKFSRSGDYLTKWGSAGSGPGQFQEAKRLAVDSGGNVYVADFGNNRIQKFDSSGGYITQWGGTGTGNGQFMGASGVAVDGSGNVYVADYINHRIQKFDGSGGYLAQWKLFPEGGVDNAPIDVAADLSGNLYVSATAIEESIQKFNSSGEFLTRWIGVFPNDATPTYLARSGSESFWAVDSRYGSMARFNGSSKERVGMWNARLDMPSGLAVDGSGNIYLTEVMTAQTESYPLIQKYDRSGWNLAQDSFVFNTGLLRFPTSVAADRIGNIFVAESSTKRIVEYDFSGPTLVVKDWSAFGSLAVDSSSNVYVADSDHDNVQKYQNGFLIAQWGSMGSGNGQFQNPGGIAADTNGNVYVADTGNNRIQKFNSNGVYLKQWGSYGSGNGEFDGPGRLAVDDSGNVYVVDYNNKRIQVFTGEGSFVAAVANSDDSKDVAVDAAANRFYLFGHDEIKNGVFTISFRTIKAYVGYGVTHFAVSAPSSATAGSPFTFTVTALDAGNSPVLGYSGKVTLTSSDGAAILPTVVSLTNGVGTFSATVMTAGTQTITASKPGDTTVTGNSNPISISPAPVADLTITKSHNGNFKQGQVGAVYTLKVTNSGSAATTGTVKVTDTLPNGLTAKSISGTGWVCTLATLTCTRSNALAAGASFPQITLKVNVASRAPASVINRAKVSGGGEFDTSNNTASDPTVVTAPISIWPSSARPGVADAGPDSAVELGVKFRSDVAGTITGIRFYKASSNTGTHTASLWTSTGTRLARATFTGETASGWQQVRFATPVSISANTVYVASYHTNVGHYSDDEYYFAGKGVDAPPLHVLADGVSGFNGVYAYGSNSKFPNRGWNSSNYWVDVIFEPLQ